MKLNRRAVGQTKSKPETLPKLKPTKLSKKAVRKPSGRPRLKPETDEAEQESRLADQI